MLPLLLALLAPPAAAEPGAAHRGLVVGGLALAGEAAGGLVLGGTGYLLGGGPCDGGLDCYDPFVDGTVGLGIGAFAGSALAGGMAGSRRGLHGARIAVASLATGGVGMGVFFAGLSAQSGPLAYAGLVTASAGMPVAAGLAAGLDTPRAPVGAPLVQLSAGVVPGGASLHLQLIGW